MSRHNKIVRIMITRRTETIKSLALRNMSGFRAATPMHFHILHLAPFVSFFCSRTLLKLPGNRLQYDGSHVIKGLVMILNLTTKNHTTLIMNSADRFFSHYNVAYLPYVANILRVPRTCHDRSCTDTWKNILIKIFIQRIFFLLVSLRVRSCHVCGMHRWCGHSP